MRKTNQQAAAAKTAEHAPNEFDEAWDEFYSFLKDKKARITQARRLVLEAALSRHDHFRADELAAELASGRKRVSRGTVYRTLALLVEAGIVRQIRDSDTHSHYEHVHGHAHHEHMICNKCGKFVEFENDELDRLLDLSCAEQGFLQKTHRVVVFGICRQCQKKK